MGCGTCKSAVHPNDDPNTKIIKEIKDSIKVLQEACCENNEKGCKLFQLLYLVSSDGARNKVLRIRDAIRKLARLLFLDPTNLNESAGKCFVVSVSQFITRVGSKDSHSLLEFVEHFLGEIKDLIASVDEGDGVFLAFTVANFCSVVVEILYQISKVQSVDADVNKFQAAIFGKKAEWTKILEQIRSELSTNATIYRENCIPLVCVNAELSELQNGVAAFTDPQRKSKLMKLAGGLVFSTIKSGLTLSIDPDIFNRFITAAQIATEKVEEIFAFRLRMSISAMRSVLSTMPIIDGKFSEEIKKEQVDSISNDLRKLQQDLLQKDPSAQVGASFIKLLAEILYAVIVSSPLNAYTDELADFIVNGRSIQDQANGTRYTENSNSQTTFWGLRGLSSFGESGELEINNRVLDSATMLKSLADECYRSFCEDKLDFSVVTQRLCEIFFNAIVFKADTAYTTVSTDLQQEKIENLIKRAICHWSSMTNKTQIVQEPDGILKDMLASFEESIGSTSIHLSTNHRDFEEDVVQILNLILKVEGVLNFKRKAIKAYVCTIHGYLKHADQLLSMVKSALQFVVILAKSLNCQWNDTVISDLAKILFDCPKCIHFQQQISDILHDKENDSESVNKKIKEFRDKAEKENFKSGEFREFSDNTDNFIRLLHKFRADTGSDTVAADHVSTQSPHISAAIYHVLEKLTQMNIFLESFQETLKALLLSTTKDEECTRLAVDDLSQKKTKLLQGEMPEINIVLTNLFTEPTMQVLRGVLCSLNDIENFQSNVEIFLQNMQRTVYVMRCLPVNFYLHDSEGESYSGIYYSFFDFTKCNLFYEHESKGHIFQTEQSQDGNQTWGLFRKTSEFSSSESKPALWMASSADSLCGISSAEQAEGWSTSDDVCHASKAKLQVLSDQTMIKRSLKERFLYLSAEFAESNDVFGFMKKARDVLIQSVSSIMEGQLKEFQLELDNKASPQEDQYTSEIETGDSILKSVFRPLISISKSAINSYLAKHCTWRVRSMTIDLLFQLKFALKRRLLDCLSKHQLENGELKELRDSKTKIEKVLNGVQSILMQRRALEVNPVVRKAFECEKFAQGASKFRLDDWCDPKAEKNEAEIEIENILRKISLEIEDASDLDEFELNLEKHLKKVPEKKEEILRSLAIKNFRALFVMHQYARNEKNELKQVWKHSQQNIQDNLATRIQELTKLTQNAMDEIDPISKGKLMLSCQKIQSVVNVQLNNVEGIGQELGLVISFLSEMQTKLDNLNTKLIRLSVSLQILDENVQKLVGEPVMTVLQRRRAEILKKALQWPRDVRIVLEGKSDVAKRESTVSTYADLKPCCLMQTIKEFLGCKCGTPTGLNAGHMKNRTTLLITGPAGSGKSTFCDDLELFILGKYFEEKRAKDIEVVCIRAHLSLLQNPFTDLFAESLRRFYNLLEIQINALREKIRTESEKIELIFILDGFDETCAEMRNKNICFVNRLPKLSVDVKGSTAPKVIFFCRSDVLKMTNRSNIEELICEICPVENKTAMHFLITKLRSTYIKSLCEKLGITKKHESFMSIVKGCVGESGMNSTKIRAILEFFGEDMPHMYVEEHQESEMMDQTSEIREMYVELAQQVFRLYKNEAISGDDRKTSTLDVKEMEWMKQSAFSESEKHVEILDIVKTFPGLLDSMDTPFMATIVLEVLKQDNLKAVCPRLAWKMLLSLHGKELGQRVWQMLIDHKLISAQNPELWIDFIRVKAQLQNDNTSRKAIIDKFHAIAKSIESTSEKQEPKDSEFTLIQSLQEVFESCTLRRFRMFKMFLSQWIDREMQDKLVSNHSVYSVKQLKTEAWTYMRRFACYLKENSILEVEYEAGSILFSTGQHNRLDEFFGIKDSLADVRAFILSVVPINIVENRYGFAQKAVVDFLVSDTILREVKQMIVQEDITGETLRKILNSIAISSKTNNVPMDLEWSEEALTITLQKMNLGKIEDDEPDDPSGHILQMRSKTIFEMSRSLSNSTLHKINLKGQEEIIQFLVDSMLDDFEVWQAFLNMFLLCTLYTGVDSIFIQNIRVCLEAGEKSLKSGQRDCFRTIMLDSKILNCPARHFQEKKQKKVVSPCADSAEHNYFKSFEERLANLQDRFEETLVTQRSQESPRVGPVSNFQSNFIIQMQDQPKFANQQDLVLDQLKQKIEILQKAVDSLTVHNQKLEGALFSSSGSVEDRDRNVDLQALYGVIDLQTSKNCELLQSQLKNYDENIVRRIKEESSPTMEEMYPQTLSMQLQEKTITISYLKSVIKAEAESMRECLSAIIEANQISSAILDCVVKQSVDGQPVLGGDVIQSSQPGDSSDLDLELLSSQLTGFNQTLGSQLADIKDLITAGTKDTQLTVERSQETAATRLASIIKEQSHLESIKEGMCSLEAQRMEVDTTLVTLREALREFRETVGRESDEERELSMTASAAGGTMAEFVKDWAEAGMRAADLKKLLESLNETIGRLDRLGVRRAASEISDQLTSMEVGILRKNAAWLRLAETCPLHWGQQRLNLRRVLRSVGELKDNAELGALLRANIRAMGGTSGITGRPAMDVVPEDEEAGRPEL